MNEFMEEFMHEMSVVFPELLIQFEDFSTDKVSTVLLQAIWSLNLSARRSLSCRASATATRSSTTTSRAPALSYFQASSTPLSYRLLPPIVLLPITASYSSAQVPLASVLACSSRASSSCKA